MSDRDSNNENKPTPDPTVLTTEQLQRAITNAITLLESKIDGQREAHNVRFQMIDRQFLLIEQHRIEQKTDTKTAVDAALSAAEKAFREQTVASEKSNIKTETSSAEQIKQQNATFTTSIKGVQDNVDNLKERINRIENLSQGALDSRNVMRMDGGFAVSIVGVLLVLATIAISIITLVSR